ncbi:MAG: metallophosphoesterase family protein [Chloroflexia bacterium]|jgi:putative phosphoesterase|nr:metallophosphoesterase family protein [Chloroflexia bacterium]
MSRYRQEWGPCTSRRRFDDPSRFGVIADTHIYANSRRKIPDGVKRLFTRAQIEFLVHLGDVNTRHVLEELAEIAPVIAVPGNNDDPEFHFMLPETTRFWVGERSFGVLHGDGGRSAKIEAKRRFAGKVDCVLFGHSHQPFMEKSGDTILFNPGSATDRRWSEHFGVGIITVQNGTIDPELVLYLDADHLDNIEIGTVSQSE